MQHSPRDQKEARAALSSEFSAVGNDLEANGDLLRGVLAGCGDCIKVLDLDGRLQFMSEGGMRVMEVDDFSVLKGCPWPDFWEGQGNADAIAALDMARAGHTGRFKGAASTAKGNSRYWDVQVSPLWGPDGRPSHLLSISRDITAEWIATEELREAVDRQRLPPKNSRIGSRIRLRWSRRSQTRPCGEMTLPQRARRSAID